MNKVFRVIWSQATQSWVAVSELTKAHKKQSSSTAKKSASSSSANLIKSSAIALALLSGHSAYAALNQPGTGGDVAVALGDGSNASGGGATVALGAGSKATGGDSFAVGWEATASATRSISIGNRSTANSGNSIALGSNTQARGDGSIAIGVNAKSNNDAEGTIVIGRDAFSEGSGNGTRPNTVVGRGAYTAFGEGGNYRLNASTALGFQAGAGVIVDPDNNRKLVRNNTNADNNAEVLVKAGYGIDDNAPAETKAALQAGSVHNGLVFYRKRHINEGTAIGVESRAVGDQSIAIGGQVVAGDGVVALGGNDSDALRDNKYQVVTDNAVRNTSVSTIDDYNLAYTESKNTVAGQYQKLVGRGMPGSYKSTYGQSGSVVIGMHAHSTTALGTAIGTNSVVRMGAFGATAIGAGSTVQPNAEAAVAIGMGSVANGAYSLAAGTASWAEYGDIALGYQAKASGKDGAIAMGRATNAQGDSSIMIGGANIESASKQSTNYEKANGQTIDKTVIEKINGQDITRKYSFAATTTTSGTVAEAYKELTGRDMNVSAIDFANISNKNGHASTSLGVHSLAKGNLATAIGAGSRADAIGSVALGVGAQATRQNAVAIGTGSTTDFVGTRQLSVNYDSDGNIVSDDSKDIAYTFKWAGGIDTSEGDVVSFGSSGAERQLKNVAAGRVAEDSTDAINGSQLNSITKRIAAGFKTSGNVVTDSSGVFTSKKANTDSAKKDYETAIRSEDKVQFQVGNNLKLDRDETETEIDVRDDFDKTKIVKKKIKKADFAYSLNPVLTNLTSAEFKGTDENAPTTKLTNDGVKITPVTAGKNPVSLTQNGLNNGGNAITNVAGNLKGAEKDTTAPTTEAAKPENEGSIKNNAATVGDVLNAGWNLKEKGSAKDFVTAYDTVDFIDGEGTSVSVETADNKTSTIKYSVKAADKSVEVSNAGVKVKTDGDTLTTGDNGLKVNTGSINTIAVPTVASGDENKIATVGNVAEAIKAAAWKATSAATANGENTGAKDQEVKAGDTVTFEADKNIKITQAEGKFTFATKDDVKFNSVQLGGDNGPKLTKTDGNDLKVSGSNGTDPVKITNVANGNISADSKDAINGSQFNAVANNNIKLGGDSNSETASQNLNKADGLKFNINGADGIETAASGDNVTVKINAETKAKIDSVGDKADKNLSNLTEAGETKIKNLVAWKAKSKNSNTEVTADTADDDGETIGADSALELEAGKNLSVKRTGKNFTFSLDKTLSGLTSAEFKKGDAPNEVTTKIDGDGLTVQAPTPAGGEAPKAITVNKDGISAGDKAVKDVSSGLTTHGGTDAKKDLVNLGEPSTGSKAPDNNAATVGDLRKMGWVVSSDKTTDNPSAPYSEAVKNADEVKFVGTGAAKVSGKTVDGVRTITVDVEASKAAQSPIVYTTAEGKKVVEKDGKFYEANPDGTADENKEVGKDQVLASLNDGNNSTATPVALRNLKSNLPETQNNNAAEGAASNATTFKDAPTDNNITHNAATVGDVLNAGWNLKGNGQAVDFVKPFDTVEFVNGSGTTVTVESKDGKSSTVKVDVAAANGIKVEDNKVVADTADLTVNQADSADAGKVATVDADKANKLVNAGSLANALNSLGWVATSDKEGSGAEAAGHAKSNALVKTGETVTFKAGDNLKIKQAGKDFTYSLNPQLSGLTSAEFKKGDAPNEVTTKIDGDGLTVQAPTPAGGEAPKAITVNKDGISAGDKAVKDVSSGLTTHGGTDAKKDLVNLGEPSTGSKAPDNNAATVGDLRKMGWVVSSDKTTDTDNPSTPYSEAVKNADEVKFVGKGAAKVSGKTEGGVRTITVDVDVAKGELESVTADNGNEKKGQVKAKSGDDAKVATVKNVADMMNALGFNVQATGSIDKDKNGQSTEPALVKAGEKVEFKGGNRIKITQDGSKFTFDVTDQAVGNIDVVDANNAAGANSEGRIKAQDGDENKHASVNTVVQAVNSAFWKAKAAGNGAESNDTPDNIKAGDTVTFEAGKNLKVTHTANNFKFETAEKPNFTGIELQASDNTDPGNKISLAPTATGDLKVAKGDNNDAVKITNVAGNLKGAEKDTTAPTTEAAKPENEGSIKNNAATVGDVLNAGWNLKEKGSAKDFVTAYDTVDFIDGEGTSVSVETADNKTSTIKYSVKAADKSVEVSNAGVKVKTDGDTLTTGDNGLKVNTGSINTIAVPTVASGDENKIATVGNVAEAIKAAAWKATSAATANGENTGAKDQDVKAGDTVTFEADKNIKITQEGGKFTFSTKDNVEFATVKVGKDDATGKKAVNLTTEAAKPVTHNGNKVEDQPTTALNVSSSDGKPTQITGVGSVLSTTDVTTKPGSNKNTDGTPTKPVTEKLVDLKGDAVNKNAAATVGDLQNMGWIVSTKDGNGYTDVVKNANQVDFKGTGLATVTGETDKESGIRTITVNVDAQKTVEAAQTPVVYTNKAGDKLVKIGDKFYKAGDVVNGKPKENAQEVPKGDVIASMNNGDNNTSKPMQLSNIGSNLPTVNDTNKQVFDPNSTTPKADKNNKSAPMTATEAAELLDPKSNKFAGNNAATVSDVLNAGWNLQGNGSAVDFVKPFDTVNFVNGKGTKAVVETADNLTSTVKFDVDAGEITSNTNGSVNGPTTAENAKKLAEDLAAAQKALNDLPADADDAAKKKAQDALKAAQDAAAPLNKVATAQNVADMINNSGFTLKTSNVEGGEKDTTSTGDEVINPGKTVEMVASKNLTVKQEANGKVTYSTKDNVEFTSVKVGEDKDGKKPVNFTTEAASPASNNVTDKTPTTALNISSSDGKPTQLKGVGSVLNTEAQPTSTGKQGDTPATAGNQNLVNLGNDPITGKSNLGSDILNSAATVGDLANMGWVVSTKDGNDYKDVVKNANQVDFKGGAGISVEGKTTTNGVREITISVKDGEVVKPNQFTAKVNGTDTPVTKVGDQYYNTADIDPKTGEPKANVTPVTPDEGTTPTNAGNGYVTGNKVAAAIQKSGFVVGKQKDALSAADFKDEVKDEKVNPDDELRFADGNNTKVKLATKESVDKDGNKVTTTTVKVDVTGLPVQYTDKNGTPVTKVGDKYFTVGDTATEVKPADLTTNMVNPAAAPNVIGAPTTLGNVKSNLPSVNDVGKDNKSAPITAEKAADIVNKAGNNAATVSDVLNAGWNLQNNGEARDFVKPYDTVNFINGKGTKAVVETADNLTSTVKFDVDAGEITADTTKPGAVKGPVTADEAKKLADDLKKAEQAVKDLPADATEDKKAKAQKALKDAQDAAAPLNKVATAQNVADMINASGFTLKTSATADGKKESGNDEIINPGKAVEMMAGKNLTVTQDKNGKVTYATANDVNFNSLSLGTSQHAPTLSADEDGSLRLGSKGNQAPVRISNVAPGIKDGDAVNVSQLKGVTKDLEDKIDGVAAGSNAAASLPQVYLPGKSMVAASVGTYGSQGALAVGYSSISDNGKWLIKGQVNVNTKAKTGGGVGVGYLW